MDYISILLTKIRNAQAVGHKAVEVPFNRLTDAILQIIADNGFVGGLKVVDAPEVGSTAKKIQVNLKYRDKEFKKPVIKTLVQVSKPGRRVYKGAGDMPKVVGGKGFGVYSTSKGLLTDKQARKENIGGEYLCEVWGENAKAEK
jgi:small subunit ribosomal protein S8